MNTYLRYLFAVTLTATLLYLTGTVASHYGLKGIAPQFNGNIAFNQKLKFLRTFHPDGPVGVVVGSSMALNNIDTDMLQSKDGKPWVNMGVWGMSPTETEDLYKNFRTVFPVREVVMVTQYFELQDRDRREMTIAPDVFRDYLAGRLNWVQEFAYRDLLQSIRQQISWKKNEGNPNSVESLVYSPTGAVPIRRLTAPADPPAAMLSRAILVIVRNVP